MNAALDWLPPVLVSAQGWSGLLASAMRIGGIVVGAWVLIVVAQRAVRALRLRIASRLDDREAVQRAETLGRVIRYLVAVIVSLVAGTLVLSEMGISVAPILGAAGVAGLAVGFGAQSLVKDYFTGFFLLVEDQIRQGDVVQLGEHSGLVEQVTLRYVQLRDYDGHVHYVPNGTITSVVNMGRDHAQAVVDVGIPYNADLDAAMSLMREVGAAMRLDPAQGARIVGDLEIAGVERWADHAIVIRARFKVAPLEQWNVRRELLRRLRLAFDRAGIGVPRPQVIFRRSPAMPLAS